MKIKTFLVLTLCALTLTGCMTPNHAQQVQRNETKLLEEGITELKAGAAAPAATAESTAGAFDLAAALAKGRVVLFFLPAIDTPNSTKELLQFSKDAAAYGEQQITIYGVGPASAAELKDYAARYGITIELIADPKLALAQAYGCARSQGEAPQENDPKPIKYPQRTLVGITQDGKVAFFNRGNLLKPQLLEAFGIK